MNSVSHSDRTHVQYIDLLRILATMAVMVIHIDPMGGTNTTRNIPSLEWILAMVFDGLSRWAVPIFFMISGALFLGRKTTISKIYSHNISHIAIAFLFWSFAYAVIREFIYGYGIKNVILETLYGHYHMWFLFSIVCLYAIVPFLQKIIEDRQLGIYFLAVSFVVVLLLPQLIECAGLFSANIAGIGNTFLNKFDIDLVSSASFYFVLGFYLHKADISPIYRKAIYILGIICTFLTVFLSCSVSIWKGEESEIFFGPSDLNIVFSSIAVFVFAKYNFSAPIKQLSTSSIIKQLSSSCFGAYLIHPMIIELLYLIFGTEAFFFGPILTVPVTFLIVCPLSFLCSWITRNIPIIGKHIV